MLSRRQQKKHMRHPLLHHRSRRTTYVNLDVTRSCLFLLMMTSVAILHQAPSSFAKQFDEDLLLLLTFVYKLKTVLLTYLKN